MSPMRTLVRFIAGVGALVGVAVVLLLVSSFIAVMVGFQGNAKFPADCGLVFGAAVYGYDKPGPAIVRRISTAARLYREGKVKTLILAGGVGRGVGESLSEAAVMQEEAAALGVSMSNIITEESSHSTWENLLYSQSLAKECDHVVGISDGYHLTRIRFLAMRQGWDNFTVLPADERPARPSELKSILREMLGLLYYVFHIDRLFGSPMEAHRAWNPLQMPPGLVKLLT